MRSLTQALTLLCISASSFAGGPAPVSSVPTLSEWGMLSLGAAIVGVGVYLIRKNK